MSNRTIALAVMSIIMAAALGSPAHGQHFTNVTALAGIDHGGAPNSALSGGRNSIEILSAGAAAGDFDGDGWVDLYVPRFWDAPLLYRNNRDGTFSNVAAQVFDPPLTEYQTNGAAWGDIDNDGNLDLAVSTIHDDRHLLYINDGEGRLVESGASRGFIIDGGAPTTSGMSVSMGDYDRDGFLDMYVTEWRGFGVISNPTQSRLFRNLGGSCAGHFVDVTAATGTGMDKTSGLWARRALAFTPRFSDFDRDGHTDLAVASDAGTSRLFWNNGDGTFTFGTASAGDVGIPAYPSDPGVGAGTDEMGFTEADFNGDGLLDWFVTSIGQGTGVHPSGNRLFLNDGDRTFTDVTDAVGVREGGWGWGADAIDYDNDGDQDIVHTNGFESTDDQTMFFKNIGTRTSPQFVNQNTAVGIVDAGEGRGLLTFDYDRDGDQDVFIANLTSPPVLYRNDGGNAAGKWLQIRTIGSESNRDGIGAYLTITPDLNQPQIKYVTEVDASSNFMGQSDFTTHFGLGIAATIDQIDVQWPSGLTQSFNDIAVNQRITITEGLRADFNGDDLVRELDFDIWRSNVGMLALSRAEGDADGDGIVSGSDFLVWQRTLGRSVQSGISASQVAFVPEPAAWELVVIAAVILLSLSNREKLHRI
jgi:hypothetical protein